MYFPRLMTEAALLLRPVCRCVNTPPAMPPRVLRAGFSAVRVLACLVLMLSHCWRPPLALSAVYQDAILPCTGAMILGR